jgi:hypothetical protein
VSIINGPSGIDFSRTCGLSDGGMQCECQLNSGRRETVAAEIVELLGELFSGLAGVESVPGHVGWQRQLQPRLPNEARLHETILDRASKKSEGSLSKTASSSESRDNEKFHDLPPEIIKN